MATKKTCRRCGGHGKDPIPHRGACLKCGGSGKVTHLNASETLAKKKEHLDEVIRDLATARNLVEATAAKGRSTRHLEPRVTRLEETLQALELEIKVLEA